MDCGQIARDLPLSELGFLRISTQPKPFGAAMVDARKALEDFLAKNAVGFIPADLPALESKPSKSVEVTDLYLAELAARNNCRLATLDGNLSHSAAEMMK